MVVIKELSPAQATKIPLSSPNSAPAPMLTAAASSGLLPFAIKPQNREAESPTIPPSERSLSPLMLTKVTPRAIISVGALCVRILIRLVPVRKLPESRQNTAIRTAKVSSEPHTSKNFASVMPVLSALFLSMLPSPHRQVYDLLPVGLTGHLPRYDPSIEKDHHTVADGNRLVDFG